MTQLLLLFGHGFHTPSALLSDWGPLEESGGPWCNLVKPLCHAQDP